MRYNGEDRCTPETDVMNVTLKPELERYIANKVASGSYPTATDVVQAGLELLRETEDRQRKLEELRQAVQIGLDQAERGEGVRMTPDRAQAIWDRAMARVEAEGANPS